MQTYTDIESHYGLACMGRDHFMVSGFACLSIHVVLSYDFGMGLWLLDFGSSPRLVFKRDDSLAHQGMDFGMRYRKISVSISSTSCPSASARRDGSHEPHDVSREGLCLT